ncbi:RimK family alpha-L-glutamate ligase [Flavobacterium sp. ASW18X]|uniref:ATP-grasp domain-containing protein n=1 Tax=Flavobacterium sp. ASW18X TaxID=2572595 RepID=UPI0010AE3908|nr:hypothetical protein [Flavobacterium sp. ASW18X]TKD65975.1 hypothetical protein FBT53_03665 [Flavobacterium sp. ASW18X]
MRLDVVLVTDKRYLQPKEDAYTKNVILEDQLVADALQNKGLKVGRTYWDDPNFDWGSTKYVIFRAVWDYFHRITEFKKWFEATAQKTKFINSKNLVEWNLDKHYFIDLANAGVHVPKTYFIEKRSVESLVDAIEEATIEADIQSKHLILKPCIAGGARYTYKFERKDWHNLNKQFLQLIAREAMMLQEFQTNIIKEGEFSLIFFGDTYSHAILKKAKPGDFRVQDDFGGSVHHIQPTKAQIQFALQAVHAAPELPVYSRIDLFKDNDNQLALAELELFEPELWFRTSKKAAQIFANSVVENYFKSI